VRGLPGNTAASTSVSKHQLIGADATALTSARVCRCRRSATHRLARVSFSVDDWHQPPSSAAAFQGAGRASDSPTRSPRVSSTWATRPVACESSLVEPHQPARPMAAAACRATTSPGLWDQVDPRARTDPKPSAGPTGYQPVDGITMALGLWLRLGGARAAMHKPAKSVAKRGRRRPVQPARSPP